MSTLDMYIPAHELTACVPRTTSFAMGIEARDRDAFAVAIISRTEHYSLPIATVMTFEKGAVELAAEFAVCLIQKTVDYGIRVPVVVDAFNSVSLQKKLAKSGADLIPIEMTGPVLDAMTRDLKYRIQDRKMLIAEDDKLRKAFSRCFIELDANANLRPVKLDRTDNIDPVYALLYAVYADMVSAR